MKDIDRVKQQIRKAVDAALATIEEIEEPPDDLEVTLMALLGPPGEEFYVGRVEALAELLEQLCPEPGILGVTHGFSDRELSSLWAAGHAVKNDIKNLTGMVEP